MKQGSSPEEVEEPLESQEDRAKRTSLPRSAFRDLLQASPSRRSAGSRTATLTPTPGDIINLRKSSLLPSSRSRELDGADESQQPVASSSKHTQSVPPSSQLAALLRSTRTLAVIAIDGEGDEDDEFRIAAQRMQEGNSPKSDSTHGPPPAQETINISDDDQLDTHSLSGSASYSLPPRRKGIRKCKGAPYIEVPFQPLPHLKRFTLPTGFRGPNPLSRNEQIHYNQSSPRSPHASSEASAGTWRVHRPERSGVFPKWTTMPNDDERSSPDLGGYGEEIISDDEIEQSDGAGSDGIEITTRTTRGAAKGKGKERETRRTTRAEAIVSDLKSSKEGN